MTNLISEMSDSFVDQHRNMNIECARGISLTIYRSYEKIVNKAHQCNLSNEFDHETQIELMDNVLELYLATLETYKTLMAMESDLSDRYE